jgi:Na+-driven multidrug efflux pump
MLNRDRSGPVSLAGMFRVRLVFPMIKNILNVGIPSGAESSMFMLGKLLTQRIFPAFGTAAIAANAVTSVITSFLFMPGNAFGLALLTIVGQCVGAGDYNLAKKQTFRVMGAAYITLFGISALIYVFMKPVVGWFSLSPQAREYALTFLRFHCFFMAFGWSMSFVLPHALRAAGDVRYVMVAATISMWAVRVCAAYLFTYTFNIGPLGVWLAMGADFFCRGALYFSRWLGGKWQKMRVIAG